MKDHFFFSFFPSRNGAPKRSIKGDFTAEEEWEGENRDKTDRKHDKSSGYVLQTP